MAKKEYELTEAEWEIISAVWELQLQTFEGLCRQVI